MKMLLVVLSRNLAKCSDYYVINNNCCPLSSAFIQSQKQVQVQVMSISQLKFSLPMLPLTALEIIMTRSISCNLSGNNLLDISPSRCTSRAFPANQSLHSMNISYKAWRSNHSYVSRKVNFKRFGPRKVSYFQLLGVKACCSVLEDSIQNLTLIRKLTRGKVFEFNPKKVQRHLYIPWP